MKENEYLLWLSSWYPNKLEPLNGDFIQRHAIAVSKFRKIILVALVHDIDAIITSDIKVEESVNGYLKEIIVYYHTPSARLGLLEKFLRIRKYLKIGKKIIRNVIKQEGNPQLIHTHIIMNAGMLANWASREFDVPYFLSEQWVAYLPEARPNFHDFNIWSRSQWFKVTNAASGISVVSNYLGDAIKKLNPRLKPVRIPNVVNTSVFHPPIEVKTKSCVHFLHVSTGGYQKNVEDIIRAANLLDDKGIEFRLHLVLPKQVRSDYPPKLPHFVSIYEECSQDILAGLFRKADAFIFYSRYETFGCVSAEANAVGIPVIASDIPVLREIIQHKKNGILVPPSQPGELALTLEEFIHGHYQFNKEKIASTAAFLYDYDKIGQEIVGFYESGLAEKSL